MQLRTRKIEISPDHQATLAMLEAHNEAIRKIEDEKKQNEYLEDVLNEIPLRFRHKSFADFEIECTAQAEVIKIIESYANTFSDRLLEGSSIIFLGVPGTGKTLLAFILYQHLVKSGFRAEYQPSLHFLRLLQEKQFESYHAFGSLLKFYKELPLLIIDEVTEGSGKGAHPADWERHLLRMLIDARYQENRCTLVITNRSRKELIERLGEPTVDRLSEKGISLAFNWNSYRRK